MPLPVGPPQLGQSSAFNVRDCSKKQKMEMILNRKNFDEKERQSWKKKENLFIFKLIFLFICLVRL